MQATDIQEEEIRISINLPYIEGTSENLRHIIRSHKIRSTFYTEMTLPKLLCKPKKFRQSIKIYHTAFPLSFSQRTYLKDGVAGRVKVYLTLIIYYTKKNSIGLILVVRNYLN